MNNSLIYNWNTTGMAIIVRQTLPLSMPGFHFGIIFITLKASLSSNGSTEVLTLIFATLTILVHDERYHYGTLNLALLGSYRVLQVLGKPLHEGRPATRKLRYLLHDGQFDRSLSSRILNGSFRNRFLHLCSIHYTRAVADNQFAGCRTDFLRCLLESVARQPSLPE